MPSRRTALLAACLTLALPVTAAAAAGAPLATVDTQRALQECKQGKAAQARIEQAARRYKQELEALGKTLEEGRKQLASLKGAELEKRTEELDKKQVELKLRMEKAEAELELLEQREMGPLVERLRAALAELTEKAGVDALVERQGRNVLYVAPGVDRTDALIRALDAAPAAAGAK